MDQKFNRAPCGPKTGAVPKRPVVAGPRAEEAALEETMAGLKLGRAQMERRNVPARRPHQAAGMAPRPPHAPATQPPHLNGALEYCNKRSVIIVGTPKGGKTYVKRTAFGVENATHIQQGGVQVHDLSSLSFFPLLVKEVPGDSTRKIDPRLLSTGQSLAAFLCVVGVAPKDTEETICNSINLLAKALQASNQQARVYILLNWFGQERLTTAMGVRKKIRGILQVPLCNESHPPQLLESIHSHEDMKMVGEVIIRNLFASEVQEMNAFLQELLKNHPASTACLIDNRRQPIVLQPCGIETPWMMQIYRAAPTALQGKDNGQEVGGVVEVQGELGVFRTIWRIHDRMFLCILSNEGDIGVSLETVLDINDMVCRARHRFITWPPLG